jgi:NAD(P)-dependent dehydrogenase (short-subunit alcohol dehydrogenase family)
MSKVAIITGGASGIGRALSEELARRGVEIVLADRQLEVAKEVAAGIEGAGGKASAAQLDVRSFEAFDALARDTHARTGRIDYLFNNAGIAVGGEMSTYGVEDYDDVIDVNLRGVTNGIQAVYPRMIAQGSGHIVNTASVAGLISAPEGSYTATKFAVVGLSKALRIEAAMHGVRVSVLCPGAVRTPILTGGKFGRIKMPNVTDAAILRAWERVRPMPTDEFARQALAAIDRNEAIIVVPRWWKALWYLERLSPSLAMRLWSRVHAKLRDELTSAP